MKANRYTVDPATGCWNWNLHVNRYGYGWCTFRGQTMHAHRAEYIKQHGAIPSHLEIDHKCRNRRCVNPSHLEAVTGTENVRRGNAAKLTREDVARIRELVSTGMFRKEVAALYGIHPAHVSRICCGAAWVVDIEHPVLTKRKPTSRFTGVSWHKAAKKWMAYLSIDRKMKYLGLFEIEEDAARAYNSAARQVFGQSAKLNEVKGPSHDDDSNAASAVARESA